MGECIKYANCIADNTVGNRQQAVQTISQFQEETIFTPGLNAAG